MQKVVTKAALLPSGESEVAAAQRQPQFLRLPSLRSSLFRFPAADQRVSSIYRSIYMRVDIWIVASAPARVDEREWNWSSGSHSNTLAGCARCRWLHTRRLITRSSSFYQRLRAQVDGNSINWFAFLLAPPWCGIHHTRVHVYWFIAGAACSRKIHLLSCFWKFRVCAWIFRICFVLQPLITGARLDAGAAGRTFSPSLLKMFCF